MRTDHNGLLNQGCRTAWSWPRDRKHVLNHAAQCGYLAAINKDLVQRAVEELSHSHSGILDRLNAKVGVVTKKRTHEDLSFAATSSILSQTPGDAPPLKRSKTEPLLGVDMTQKVLESKQVIRPGQNFAEMFQMEGKKALKEKANHASVGEVWFQTETEFPVSGLVSSFSLFNFLKWFQTRFKPQTVCTLLNFF